MYNEEEMTCQAKEVVEIFESCFGEEHIDVLKSNPKIDDGVIRYYNLENVSDDHALNRICQGGGYRDIIIKIDHETVTNELGMSTELFDFFVRIQVGRVGEMVGYPYYKRATFTEEQLFSQYIHSHTPRLMLSEDGIQSWGSVCLGSGPIRNTISQLWRSPRPELWLGFIAELRQIVRHESLEGGPYMRMEYIKGPSKGVDDCRPVSDTVIKPLIPLMKSYIRAGRLRLGFIGHEFCLGVPFTEWLIDFSEYAKVWAAQNNTTLSLAATHIQNNKIFDANASDASTLAAINNILGKKVIVFKGTEYKLKQIKRSSTTSRQLIPYATAATLLRKTLNVLNFWYYEQGTRDAGNTPVYK